MAGKLLTKQQQSHVAGLITGLVAALDHKEMQWTRQHRQDLEIAFSALGQPCPFAFSDAKPAAPEQGPFKRMFQSARDRLGMP